jgi:2-deoxy-D-gluconate 3-dehydrogenase
VVKVLIAQGRGGKIINTASMLSFQGGILVPSYTSSKSAVMGLTRLMACELAKHKINTNAIAPGYMATDNTKPRKTKPVIKRFWNVSCRALGDADDLKGIAVSWRLPRRII